MPNNDLISREAAIAEVEQWAEHGYDVIHWTGIKAMLETQPAVDAAPVVHGRFAPSLDVEENDLVFCKDCMYYSGDGFGWCERKGIGHCTSDDWFCADGEKRGEDE